MSIRVRYTLIQTNQPSIALRGRWVRPRPLIDVSLLGPAGTYLNRGLLDYGSDDTIFPQIAAVRAGIDLSNAPSGMVSGLGLGGTLLRFAEVTLRIAGGSEQREWKAWVGFTATPLKRPVLGFAGFLQFFTAHFHGDREEFELEVNGLYPGT